MDKTKAYLAGILMVALASIPPIDFRITAPHAYWPYFVVLSGFLGFYTIFINTGLIVKLVACGGFLLCFFSRAPYISFTAYISLVFCCYFYILCRSIKDYQPVFKILQTLMLYVVFMFIIQRLGFDTLLNFGRTANFNDNYCFGIVGQHMQSGSFSIILAAALLPFTRINLSFPFLISLLCNSAGTALCALIGAGALIIKSKYRKYIFIIFLVAVVALAFWIVESGKLEANISMENGRSAVWLRSLKMTGKHPIAGWGLATYKSLFPALNKMYDPRGGKLIPWKTAHNCWIQMAFEIGYPATCVIAGYVLYLLIGLIKLIKNNISVDRAYCCLAGLLMIAVNMMIHFPSRQASTVLIIIFFLAYSENVIKGGGMWPQQNSQ